MTQERVAIEALFMIANKSGDDVPFKLNPVQRHLDENLTGRDLVPKARQEGVSAYVLALFAVRCMYKRNTRAVVISHDNESTERLFKRVNYYLQNMKSPPPITGFASRREYTFPKTNSMFYIGTAGARKFGRGDTITDLHCSEVAFWDKPKELFSGLSDAVPHDGTIILESTGNGRNWYFRRVMNSYNKKGRYTIHFFNWQDFPEYDLSVTDEEIKEIEDSLDPDFEEDILYNTGQLTAGQIKFRREKLEEKDFDVDLFKQEYPMSLEECFRATGRSIFYKVLFVDIGKRWKRIDLQLSALEGHPKKGGIYAIGADVGGGIGKDRSVAQVVDLELMEQVGEWTSDNVSPDVFGDQLAQLGKFFNNAYITVESNLYGVTTLDHLKNNYPSWLIHRKETSKTSSIMDLGLLQTSRTKPLSLGMLSKLLATVLVIHSTALSDELGTFVEHESGKLGAEDGCFDDRVMAFAAFAMTHIRAMIVKGKQQEVEQKVYSDPFTLDAILKEMQKSGRSFPITPQLTRYLQ